MNEGGLPTDDETDEPDDEREDWLADEIPDGVGCVEIWDRLSDARDDD